MKIKYIALFLFLILNNKASGKCHNDFILFICPDSLTHISINNKLKCSNKTTYQNGSFYFIKIIRSITDSIRISPLKMASLFDFKTSYYYINKSLMDTLIVTKTTKNNEFISANHEGKLMFSGIQEIEPFILVSNQKKFDKYRQGGGNEKILYKRIEWGKRRICSSVSKGKFRYLIQILEHNKTYLRPCN